MFVNVIDHHRQEGETCRETCQKHSLLPQAPLNYLKAFGGRWTYIAVNESLSWTCTEWSNEDETAPD
jgi:hypothetical protein